MPLSARCWPSYCHETGAGRHGPCGAQDEFVLAATAQNLRKLARLCIRSGSRIQATIRSALRR